MKEKDTITLPDGRDAKLSRSETPPTADLPKEQEEFAKAWGPVIHAIRLPRKYLTSAPTFTPKSFAEQIQFVDTGSAKVLYVWINDEWIAISAGGGVAGSDREIQFNDGGVLGADAGFTFTNIDDSAPEINLGTSSHVAAGITSGATDEFNISVTGALNLSSGSSSGFGKNINIDAGTDVDGGGEINIRAGAGLGGINIEAGIGNSSRGGGIVLNPGQGDGAGNRSGDILAYTKSGDGDAETGRFAMTNSSTGFSERFVGGNSTTDATPSTSTLFTAPANRSVLVEAKVIATRTGGTSGSAGDSGGYIRRATYKTTGGTTSLVGSIQDDYTVEDQAGWDVTFIISGNNIQLQLTGAANNNITWVFEITLVHTGAGII